MTKKDELLELIDDLEKLIQERITENNKFKDSGMVAQATHAYLLYRRYIYDIRNLAIKL